MRRRPRTALLLPLIAIALASGCSSGAAKSAAGPRAQLPAVKGAYGSKPSLTFAGKQPPTALVSKVLREGTGKVVAKGDLLVADYLGQVWRGAVFDNSYDRKTPAGFVIGTGKVIPGWDQVLVGKRSGSRVIMSVPPALGYGSSGNAQAGIKGTDTLVFVVDLIASYDKTAMGDPAAVRQRVTTPGVTITGALGAPSGLTISKGAKAPAKPKLTVLAKGTGSPVTPGLLVVQYAATRYGGASAGSTFADGAPAAITVTGSSSGTPFDLVRGVPLGSRVLLELPASSGEPGVAVVVDLVAEPKTAAASG